MRVLMLERPALGRAFVRGREGGAENVQSASGDVWSDVAVDVGSDRDASVSQNLGDDVEGYAFGKHDRCGGVPKRVQPNSDETDLRVAVVSAGSAFRGSQGSPVSVSVTKT
jgi:hypothetical protein